jgi:predicted transposase/invertase (TIGR01784 family)
VGDELQKEQSRECKSKRIQEMHRRVCQIKASEKAEVKYMQTWEEKILIKQEGIAEGRLEGRLEGKLEEKQELTRKLSNKFSIEQIAEILEIDISEVENILKESQNGK